ncbi:MAG TPA: ATP-binding cassette domain-containing protein [Actinoplanes sp.]|jgi:daunorubicin resistance ABC transporter ATP-binding subunit|nr:ATP-binding cassette domain-containing protein [Actinoplanes sp.]
MTESIIAVDDAVKTFGGGRRALDGLSLRVPSGVVFGLLGPNGAGKTTLIRVLATLLPLDAGTARVAGHDVDHDPGHVRNRIGLAGQYAAVDDYLTGWENVEMVGLLYGLTRREARRRTVDVLDRIGLAGVGGRQVRTYSGGMRRRLDLAASLVGRPTVLFLDEPTTGVDPASRRDLWELIRGLVDAGTTVLLTTQYLEEADRLADRIALIDHGRIVSEGTTDDLKNRVGDAMVELDVPTRDRTAALGVLGAICATVRADGPRASIVVPAPDGERSLHQVLHHLESAGVRPDTVGLRKPTLDEAFLSLTGSATAGPGRAAG